MAFLAGVFQVDRHPKDFNPRPGDIRNRAVPGEKPGPHHNLASIGDLATLELPGSNFIWLAVSDNDWDALIDAENFGAQGGPGATNPLKRLAEAGRVFPCENGTKVRVSKTSFTGRYVEVLAGPNEGLAGWVQVEFVKRAN